MTTPTTSTPSRTRARNGNGWHTVRRDGRHAIGWTELDSTPRTRTLPASADWQRELRDELTRRDAGLPQPDRALTVAGWCATFLQLVEGSVRPSTFATYTTEVARIADSLGRRKLAELSDLHVARYLAERRAAGASPVAVDKSLNVLRIVLNRAMRSGKLARNVASLVDAPPVEPTTLHLPTPDELRRLRDAVAGDRLAPCYAVAIETGMRQGELLGLRWGDLTRNDDGSAYLTIERSIEHRGNAVHAPKTRAGRRVIHIRAELVAVLDEHRRRQLADGTSSAEGYMFTGTLGGRLYANRLLEHLHDAQARAGLPRFRWHDLRHGRVASAIRAGVSIELIGAYVGHADRGVTADLYGHLNASHLDAGRLAAALGD